MKLGKLISAGLVSLTMTTAAMARDYVRMVIQDGYNLPKMDIDGSSDPYVEWWAGTQKGKTHVIDMKKGATAEWNYVDGLELDDTFDEIEFIVKEKDGAMSFSKIKSLGKSRKYGTVKLRVDDIEFNRDLQLKINGKYSMGDNHQPAFITVCFTPITQDQYIDILKKRKN